MIDLRFLEQLLDLLNRSDAGSIEIRKWTTTVKISKNAAGQGESAGYQVGGPGVPAPGESPAPDSPRIGGGGEGGGKAAGLSPARSLIEIKSPMVGTYYARPEPGAEPYVRVGSRIQSGSTLCIIEAMKIMNPLDSEVSGVVREISVEDSQPVEFGQVLFRVDPNG